MLEHNDFILDWKMNKGTYRFCHLYDKSEIEEILSQTNFQIIKTFKADGPNHEANVYYIVKKV